MSAPASPPWVNSDVLQNMEDGVAADACHLFRDIQARFVDQRPAPGCWYWIGDISAAGYGVIRSEVLGHSEAAHRWAFAAAYGPGSVIGKEVHHACRVKHCVNPMHLRALTREEHTAEHARLNRGKWPRKRCTGCNGLRPVKDGVIWKHGPWGAACPGSGLPPALEVSS